MHKDEPRRLDPIVLVFGLVFLVAVAIALLERGARSALDRQRAGDPVAPNAAEFLNRYLAARHEVVSHPIQYGGLALLGLVAFGGALYGCKRLAAATNAWRARRAGMAFAQASYELRREPFSLRDVILRNPSPEDQVVLGIGPDGRPVYLTDHARSMHTHVLGQTGSGKTKSVIEPLMLQDMLRGRGVLVVDGKGSQENEERFVGMAALCGRRDDVRVFTLNPFRPSHTYNVLHLVPDADPLAVAQRVFSSFEADMDNPYYKDQARMLFQSLVCAFAGTGKRFSMLDVAAALASPEVLDDALQLSADKAAVRRIEAQYAKLGKDAEKTFTGLQAAVDRYNVPAVNAYDPDIVLEDLVDRDGLVAFFLPANYAKYLARYLGLVVFQHLQQLGALRQLDRSRSQRPVYVYADEFYSFAYEGFTDAVNKLRDAKIAMLLAHQTFSDLEKVSPEYAKGIWDNTRNKIILYQNDPEVCERVAKALGTEKGVELTQRYSADTWLNQSAMLEASGREVDAYRCHPTRIKMLKLGQAYLAQDADFVGVNLGMVPDLPVVVPPPPKPPSGDGLNLMDRFLGTRGA
jgi:type IV secretory pathway TraG/TraD family ATPase VirD4